MINSKNAIVFVSPNIKKDGAEKSLVALQVYLNKTGINTLVIIPKHGEIEELFKENNVNYAIHNFVGSVNAGRGTKIIRGLVKYLINRLEAKKLKKILHKKTNNIIGVHSNTITSDFGHYLALELNIPHIWHIREFGKLDFNFDFELGMKYMKHCTDKATKIVCNSKAVADYYEQYFDKTKITYVHNGVPIKEKCENNWKDDIFKMVLIGRLSKEKGQELAIEACNTLNNEGYSNFVLDLYGSGIDEERLKIMINKYNLTDKVFLKGYCSNIPVNEYHVGLMCSHHEAFGRVTIEYMMNAIPVVGVNMGGTAEIIEDEVTGILFNIDDKDSFVNALKRLYKDRNLCIEMGIKGRKRAEKLFSEETYCNNILKIYNEVLFNKE